MFGLFSGPANQAARPKPRLFLRLEGLESREQPDGGLNEPPPPPVQIEATGNQAPEIVDFSCTEIQNGYFLVTGRVIDESPDGLVVTLGGSTSAAGTTVNCNPDGTFSVYVQLRTDGTDSGYITATTVDDEGAVSEEVDYFVNPTP